MDNWSALLEAFASLRKGINQSRAVNINADRLRQEARAVVQMYFRGARPNLQTLGFTEETMQYLDQLMQRLLTLSNGRNAKASYVDVLRKLANQLRALELDRELRIGQSSSHNERASTTPVEQRIIQTLENLIPTARLSYSQALADLGHDRVSYRGTAAELRECLREVLDHLAPDEKVAATDGFKLEPGATKPTQKQKVRYILKTRGVPKNAMKAPEDSASLVEELTASLARATYQRGSISSHVESARREVLQLKMYVDSVLAELLEVHA